MGAAIAGNLEIVRYLLLKGADTTKRFQVCIFIESFTHKSINCFVYNRRLEQHLIWLNRRNFRRFV